MNFTDHQQLFQTILNCDSLLSIYDESEVMNYTRLNWYNDDNGVNLQQELYDLLLNLRAGGGGMN